MYKKIAIASLIATMSLTGCGTDIGIKNAEDLLEVKADKEDINTGKLVETPSSDNIGTVYEKILAEERDEKYYYYEKYTNERDKYEGYETYKYNSNIEDYIKPIEVMKHIMKKT